MGSGRVARPCCSSWLRVFVLTPSAVAAPAVVVRSGQVRAVSSAASTQRHKATKNAGLTNRFDRLVRILSARPVAGLQDPPAWITCSISGPWPKFALSNRANRGSVTIAASRRFVVCQWPGPLTPSAGTWRRSLVSIPSRELIIRRSRWHSWTADARRMGRCPTRQPTTWHRATQDQAVHAGLWPLALDGSGVFERLAGRNDGLGVLAFQRWTLPPGPSA